MSTLLQAIRAEEVRVGECIDLIRGADGKQEKLEAFALLLDEGHSLHMSEKLLRCLRRLVEESSLEQVYKAFGAPGDFGYESELGAALSDFYRSTKP